MKLVDLELVAFGPFAGTRLDFSGEPGLHVVYGRNEAGKSTALRAIRGLLFGIPDLQDAWAHREPRVAATLCTAAGDVLRLTRRKGRKNTLLDAAGQPVDEGVLARALGSVPEAMFRSAFALDHETLRLGAEALLAGKGDVRESLFDAGLGGRGVHRLLEELEQQAQETFAPRASTAKLNRALAAYKEAQARGRDAAVRASGYQEQLRGLDDARRLRDELLAERLQLKTERKRLDRILAVLRPLAEHHERVAQRAALGTVIMLPEDAAAARERLTLEAATARDRAQRLRADVAALEARIATLEVAPEMVALDADLVEQLANRAAAVLKEQSDLPRRRTELKAAEADVRALVARAGAGPDAARKTELRPSAAAQELIRELAGQAGGLEADVAHAASDVAETRPELERLRMKLATVEPSHESDGLKHALEAARRAGDLDARIDEGERAVSRAALAVEAARTRLGIGERSASDVAAAAVPTRETLDRFAGELDAVERVQATNDDRARAQVTRRDDSAESIDALRRSGDVPTEGELEQARSARDAIVLELRSAHGRTTERLDDLAREIGAADRVADRLRRETARVAELAHLEAAQAAAQRALEGLATERAELDRRRADVVTRWEAAWQPTGVLPRAPVEMRGWLERLEELRGALRTLAGARASCDEARALRAQLAAPLARELAEHGESLARGGEHLAELVEAASRRAAKAERRDREREALERSAEALEKALTGAAGALERALAAREAWRERFAEAARAIALAPDASPMQASAQLEVLAQLATKVAEADKLGAQIASMVSDVEAFERDTARLVVAHAPDLAAQSAQEAARALVRRHREARAKLDKRQERTAELEEARRSLDAAERQLADAAAALGALCRTARVDGVDALEAAEQRSHEARRLDARIAELDAQLRSEGGGVGIDALSEEARELAPDAARARRDEIDARIEEIDELARGADREVANIDAGMRALGGDTAASAAVDAQEALAAVRAHALRYARARAAVVLVRRELERYRERHQGPIVGRASALFAELTGAAWSGLVVGFGEGDEPVLECVQAGGAHVAVANLSEGTRDALYLALRLATFERHGQNNEPLPFVLDDVFVHIDDPRTERALAVLGAVAANAQILLFTHHEHVVTLAKRAVSAPRLRVHDLDALRAASTAPRDATVDA